MLYDKMQTSGYPTAAPPDLTGLQTEAYTVAYLLPSPALLGLTVAPSCLQIRGIVVGTKGAVIGEVGIAARKSLETILAKRVHLILNVKVASH